MKALAVLALAAVLTGAALLIAHDGESATARSLVWAARPRLIAGHLLYGQLRNDGPRALELTATRLRVLDVAGHPLPSDGRFLQAYAPRAGRALTLAPGHTTPLTVAWRGAGARRVVLGAIVLDIPR